MRKLLLLPLCCFSFALTTAYGQSAADPAAGKAPARKEQRQVKRAQEAKQKPDYDPAILGHAYFGSEAWVPGSLWYDGTAFRHTPLRYDLVREEVTLPPDEPDAPAQKLRLISQKVDSFAVHGHTFVRLTEQAGVPEGFYDKLYDGQVKVRVRRQKYVFKETTYQKVTERFLSEDRYYLRKDGKYRQVKGQAGVLQVLQDQKKALSAYIQKENIDFQKDFEQALVQVVTYYDQLMPK